MAFKSTTPGCPCCGGGTHTVTLYYCDSTASHHVGSGLTVTLKSGATTIETQTTDANGRVTFATLGSYTLVAAAPHPRFAAISQAITTTAGGSSIAVFGPASGYVCAGCAYPIADTLNGTISGGISWTGTLSWDGSAYWVGSSFGVTMSNCGTTGCFYVGHPTVNYQFRVHSLFDGRFEIQYRYEEAFGCPWPGGAWSAWLNFDVVTGTCFVPSTSSFQVTSTNSEPDIGCFASTTTTFTE